VTSCGKIASGITWPTGHLQEDDVRVMALDDAADRPYPPVDRDVLAGPDVVRQELDTAGHGEGSGEPTGRILCFDVDGVTVALKSYLLCHIYAAPKPFMNAR